MLRWYVILLFTVSLLLSACQEESYQPKPKGYFRLEYPAHEYQQYLGDCPFEFNYSSLALIRPFRDSTKECWFDIYYPHLKAAIHLSYDALKGDLASHLEDSRTLAYKHTVKATNIEEFYLPADSNNNFSLVYKIYGNTASSVQFFSTDSSRHFLRGALYFTSTPNSDSLEPSITYIQEDIEEMLKSLRWK